MIRRFYKKSTLVITVITLLILPTLVSAQSENGRVGITVSPITDEFTIKPGQVKQRTIQVINPNDSVVTLYPQALDFTTDNENGQPAFFKATDSSANYTLSRWITFDKEFVRIAKGEQELVKITISAPENAEPGGHYGAVLFSTEKPDLGDSNDAQVGVVGLVGTLYLATVPGKTVEKLELEQFNVPSIIFAPPALITAVFKNSGNVHQKPTGEIIVKNWSGNQAGFLELNPGKGNVLPESRRRFDNLWQFDPLRTFGIYTFSLTTTYGKTPVELTASKKVLVLPIWLIAVIVLVAVYIIRKIWRLKRQKPRQISDNPSQRRILR